MVLLQKYKHNNPPPKGFIQQASEIIYSDMINNFYHRPQSGRAEERSLPLSSRFRTLLDFHVLLATSLFALTFSLPTTVEGQPAHHKSRGHCCGIVGQW